MVSSMKETGRWKGKERRGRQDVCVNVWVPEAQQPSRIDIGMKVISCEGVA